MKRHVAARIPENGGGRTLLDYLTSRFTYHSRDEWRKHIADGELALDGVCCQDPARLLAAGAEMEYSPGKLVEPPVRGDYRIVFEDDWLLVIDKPGNLPVHPAGPYFEHTLWALLHETYPDVHFINRLDRETSGLLLAARSVEAARILSRQLPEMRKLYRVIVHGIWRQPLDAVGVLVRDEASKVRKKRRFLPGAAAVPGGESAATRLTPERSAHELTLLRAELRTGRMHQIRATLFSLGFPVLGDKLYGLNEDFYRRLRGDLLTAADRAELRLDRQALHCAELSIHHPADGRPLVWQSALPAEFEAVLA